MPLPYVNPVPSGKIGRTDQGVDVSAPPGTPVRAIADERLIGIIPNWFRGQPFYYFKELGSGAINYVAEQFRSSLRVGQTVQAGQDIGTVASSGTGLELGFAQSEAAARTGHPTPGYQEGQATALGHQYRTRVFGSQGGFAAPRSIVVAASVFGGPGDPSTGRTGYHGDNLSSNPDSFAELSKNPGSHDFSALGNLPYMAPITITNLQTGQSTTLYKRDVGAGGSGLSGHPRAIDVWYQAAQQIGLSGVGLVRVSFGGAGGAGAYGLGRPGGTTPGQRTGPDPTDILTEWSSQAQGSTGGATPDFTSFDPSFSTSDAALFGVPFLPNPLDLYKGLSGSVQSAVDFFKILAWIINPANILRMVEFLVGLALMAFGFQAFLQAYGEGKEGFVTSEGALSRSGLGRVSREVAAAASAAVPEAKAAKAGRAATSGGGKSRRIRPETAPHRTRRQALRLRYEREKKVSQRRTRERREA